jgi:hypothetical protein
MGGGEVGSGKVEVEFRKVEIQAGDRGISAGLTAL